MTAKKKKKVKKDLGRTPKFILNPEWSESKEEVEKLEDQIYSENSMFTQLDARRDNPFAAHDTYVASMKDHFPDRYYLKLPASGAWILITKSPPTEFTVAPFSMWWATPWPMDSHGDHKVHRAKIITPRGNLGVFPHEYSKIEDISKYIGREVEGISFHFFSGKECGIDNDQLFYIMSRGVNRREAMLMLLPVLKSPNVGWFETRKEYADTFGLEWPAEDRLATKL